MTEFTEKVVLDESYDPDSKERREWFKENILDKLYSIKAFVTTGFYSCQKPISDCIFQDLDVRKFGINKDECYIHPIYSKKNYNSPLLVVRGFEAVEKDKHYKVQYIFNEYECAMLSHKVVQIYNELAESYPDAEILF